MVGGNSSGCETEIHSRLLEGDMGWERRVAVRGRERLPVMYDRPVNLGYPNLGYARWFVIT